MTYFWDKKTKISYVLAIFVLWIHNSSFFQYDSALTIPYLRFGDCFMRETFSFVAVPLVFIISGALFYRDYTQEKYKEKLLRRVKSLVIPYIIWNTLNMIFSFLATAFLSDYFTRREKAVISLPNILLGIFHYKYSPFWFVFALIVFTIAAPVIDKLLYSKTTAVLSIIALIVLNYFELGLPVPLFGNRTCIIYYMVGGLIGRYYFDLFTKRGGVLLQMASAGTVVSIVVYCMLICYDILKRNEIVDVVLLIVFSISFWYAFDLVLPQNKKIIVHKFEKHSFMVYAMHLNIDSCVVKILYALLPKIPIMGYLNFVLATIITLLLIEMICQMIKRISPTAYELLSGAR